MATWRRRVARLAAVWIFAVTVSLLVLLVGRPQAAVNWLTTFTVITAAAAGAVAWVSADRAGVLAFASLLLLLAALPAMYGLLGLLYLPGVLLLLIAAALAGTR